MIVNLYSSSAQGRHCHISHSINFEYTFLSCIYAANAPSLRVEQWVDLLAIKECMIPVPLLLVGDFNSFLSIGEHSKQMGLSVADYEFSQRVTSTEVTDYRFNGPIFTWSSKQVHGYIAKELDKTMVNVDFMATFPSAHT